MVRALHPCSPVAGCANASAGRSDNLAPFQEDLIAQITRDGKTYYRVAVNRGGDRQTDYLTVSDTGRVVNDLDRR